MNEQLTELIHEVSLDTSWLDEQIGDVDGFGWYGLISFDARLANEVNKLGAIGGRCMYNLMSEHDMTLITGMWGAILNIDSQGNKYVTLLEGTTEADEQWEATVHEYRRWCLAADVESLARGEACPSCGEDWRPNRHGGRMLDHKPGCGYVAALEEEGE